MDLLFCAKAIDAYFLHTKITFAFEMFECQSFVMIVYSSIHNLYVILDIIHHIRKIKISNGGESSFMDTGTHVAMGVALGGLATLDPVVSNDSTLFTAVMVGTLIGSQAPDFDTVLKLKDNAAYIRRSEERRVGREWSEL